MALELSAVDAVAGGIATAFFGGLLAAGAYLLKQLLALREHMVTLETRMDSLRAIEESMKEYGDEGVAARASKRLMSHQGKEDS